MKTSWADFTTAQLERDVALSKFLQANIHLLAALDTVDTESIQKAQNLCAEAGLELLVYDRAQLRPHPASDAAPPNTAADLFENLHAALTALSGDLESNSARAERRAGPFLKTALEPRRPSSGQVEALKALINHYGTDLIAR